MKMNVSLTGSMMLRSIIAMRRIRRAGSGAWISISVDKRLSHWTWLGFINLLRTKNLSAQQLQYALRNLLHRPQPPDPFVTAREHPLVRTDEFCAALFQRLHVFLRRRVQPHLAVHRRCNQ